MSLEDLDAPLISTFLDHAEKVRGLSARSRNVRLAAIRTEQVAVADDSDPNGNNVPLTDEKFPFVFHIACNACLNSDKSPSAVLNEKFEDFAKALDERLYDGILKMKVFDKEQH
jgi:hypothetical protein